MLPLRTVSRVKCFGRGLLLSSVRLYCQPTIFFRGIKICQLALISSMSNVLYCVQQGDLY